MAASPPSNQKQQGFTLIEILVVVVIIGVLLSATVALRGDHSGQRALIAEGERLKSVLLSAQQAAVRSGLPFRLTVSDTGYGFLAFQPDYDEAPPPVTEGGVSSAGLSLAGLARQPEGTWRSSDLRALREYQPERETRFTLKVADKTATQLLIPPSGLTPVFSVSLSFAQVSDRIMLVSSDGVSPPDYRLISPD